MTSPEARAAILALDTCEPSDTPVWGARTHLVGEGNRRFCDGRVMRDPVIADSERPTCLRCRDAFDVATGLYVPPPAPGVPREFRLPGLSGGSCRGSVAVENIIGVTLTLAALLLWALDIAKLVTL